MIDMILAFLFGTCVSAPGLGVFADGPQADGAVVPSVVLVWNPPSCGDLTAVGMVTMPDGDRVPVVVEDLPPGGFTVTPLPDYVVDADHADDECQLSWEFRWFGNDYPNVFVGKATAAQCSPVPEE